MIDPVKLYKAAHEVYDHFYWTNSAAHLTLAEVELWANLGRALDLGRRESPAGRESEPTLENLVDEGNAIRGKLGIRQIGEHDPATLKLCEEIKKIPGLEDFDMPGVLEKMMKAIVRKAIEQLIKDTHES